MKIQHKRSNQLDSGEAKAPLVDFMEYGELAVNFNKEDPAIFVKVSDGTNALNDQVIRIAGLGSISGGVPDGPTNERPDTPSLGDLYFDTDLNLLLYWDGSEWKPVGKDNVALISETAPNTTQYPEGTFWWDSSEDSGRLFILYNDPTDANELFWVEASPGGSGGSKTVVQEAPPAPGNFVEGDMWWSSASDSGQLFILYDDPVDNGGGGKTWVAAAPSNNATDYVKKAGDNMTGPLTIGPEGGPAVTTLAADGSAEFASDVQMASQNGGPLAGFRNQIINGNFEIAQRGVGPFTNDMEYTLDRWKARNNGGDPINVIQMSVDVPGHPFALRYQATTGAPSGGVDTFIELPSGYTNGPFAPSSTWTLSYWSNTPLTTAIQAQDRSDAEGTANRATGGAVQTLDTYNTFTKYSQTFTMPAAPFENTKTCLKVVFTTGSLPADFILTGVQLEPGPVATPFEHRPVGTELALCQRYYQVLIEGGYKDPTVGIVKVANQIAFPFHFLQEMRSAPQIPDPGITNLRKNDQSGDEDLTGGTVSILDISAKSFLLGIQNPVPSIGSAGEAVYINSASTTVAGENILVAIAEL